MGADLFSIGVSGLIASQAALSTTSNNISNASTPGYTREVAQLAPLPGQATQYGYLGSGVQSTSVQRQISTYLNANVQSAQSTASEQSSYFTQVSQLSDMLGSSSTDLGNSLQTFFTGFQQVASDPASIPARQKVLSNSQILVDQFQTIGSQISNLNGSLNQAISLDVNSINTYAQQIAGLNQSILTVSQGGNAQPPNDLLDKRDLAVANLSKLVGVSVVSQPDGAYNVFFGNGQGLVVGGKPYTLAAVNSTTDPGRIQIAFSASGVNQPLPDSAITGGDLGAMLKFRTDSLDPTTRKLGVLAAGFALNVNTQHALGTDLKNVQGDTFFSLNTPQVAAATTNQGTATLTASFVGAHAQRLQPSDYQVSFDGSNYKIARTTDQTAGLDGNGQTAPGTYPASALTNGASVEVDGISFSLNGPMTAGDSFLVKPVEGSLAGIGLKISDPIKLAASGGPVAVTAGSSNSGGGKLVVSGLSGAPAFSSPATVSFIDATTYSISGSVTTDVTGAALPANHQIVVDGVTLTLSGVPNANDSFSVGNNASGVGNNQNAVAMAALQTAGTVDGGNTTFAGLYSGVVSDVGSRAAQYKSTSTTAEGVLSSAVAAQQTVSGVNLDEEAAQLLKYQQQYQACAKVVQIASTLFQSILQLN
jgi:flagellar hook-associated protein 1 FlgK